MLRLRTSEEQRTNRDPVFAIKDDTRCDVVEGGPRLWRATASSRMGSNQITNRRSAHFSVRYGFFVSSPARFTAASRSMRRHGASDSFLSSSRSAPHFASVGMRTALRGLKSCVDSTQEKKEKCQSIYHQPQNASLLTAAPTRAAEKARATTGGTQMAFAAHPVEDSLFVQFPKAGAELPRRAADHTPEAKMRSIREAANKMRQSLFPHTDA